MTFARTEKDKKKDIARLRSKLKGYPVVRDEYLEQFLIARSWNIDGAFKQLIDTFAWRKENGIDMYPVATKENDLPILCPVRGFLSIPDQNLISKPSISESVLRVYKNMGGSCLHKVDKDGCPIYIERLGLHQAKKIAKDSTAEEIFHYHVGCNEFLHRVVMKDCSDMAGRHINRETVIFDCTGMGWSQLHMPAINFLKLICDVDQKYYPETLNKLFLVNAPGAFVYFWKIVKTWLDPGTINKIKILGTDYQSQLLDHIDAENLPNFLGGTCICDHIVGGCVPSQVLKNVPRNIPTKDNDDVPTPYNADVMEKAKYSLEFRGSGGMHSS